RQGREGDRGVHPEDLQVIEKLLHRRRASAAVKDLSGYAAFEDTLLVFNGDAKREKGTRRNHV
ncbi:MAG: hypothetical protein ACXWWV_11885, partial [Candidatus Deferrimicrobiaceae bacterium]